ncbi:MAG: hypothetical protein JO089_04195 [Alphaproteobacteria bacterium]|nr:hypothetical protein [Alphaproteobacteria bacterium]
MRRSFMILGCALTLAPLAACLEPPATAKPAAAPLSFAKAAPIYLAVSSIKVVDEYHSPAGAVEEKFSTTPAEAMHQWIKERLRPVGNDRILEVIIKDANVKATPLAPQAQGIQAPFTDEQAARYDARLLVEMRVYGDQPMSEASLHVEATRFDTLPESASPAARKALYNRMVKELMEAANAELEKEIYQYFSNYVTYPTE